MAWKQFFDRKIQLEWDFGRKAKLSPSVGFSFAGEEEDYRFFFAMPRVAQVWLTLRDMPRFWDKSRAGLRWYEARRFELNFHHNTLWLHFCDPEYGGYEMKHEWLGRRWSLSLEDLIFGESKRVSYVASTQTIPARLPESVYSCVVEEEREAWYWPRFRRPQRSTLWNITSSHPIPIPGKGENAWDCNEDAIYEVSFRNADNPQHAVDLLIEDVLETRLKRGGAEWKPFSEYHRDASKK